MKQLFDTIRNIKGAALTQGEVDAINAAMAGVPANLQGPASGNLNTALRLIKQFEGCRLTAYPDPGSGGDPWTIGWGSTGLGIAKGVTWTQEQADARLEQDVARFAAGVDALVKAPTTADERGALVSFAYNVGLGNLKSSTLLKLHNAGDKAGAADQFARWDKAAGKVMAGLTRRRAAEAAAYRGQA